MTAESVPAPAVAPRGGSDPAPGVTEIVARFACPVDGARDVVTDVDLAAATRSLVDTVGVALAARDDDAVRALARWVAREPAGGGAVVWGESVRRAPSQAALLNGTAGHALDFDDACPSMPLHPSTVLWPALLAEVDALGGDRLVEAVAVGNAVMRALGEALPMDEHYGRGWHSTATLGRLAAVAALARLHGLDVEATRHALGLVASMAGGSIANFGTGTKPLHAGLAARDAVTAVGLVRCGLDANPSQLEHRLGFLAGFGSPADDVALTLGARLDHWRTAWVDDWSLKRYPSCYGTHRAVDAALVLRDELGAPPLAEISAIEVFAHPGSLRPLLDHLPTTGTQGKFSLPYTVVRALADGELPLGAFTDEAVADPALADLVASVKVHGAATPPGHDDLAGTPYALLRVTLSDGCVAEHLVLVTRGDARNPLSDDEVDAKFLAALAGGGHGPDEAATVLAALRGALCADNAGALGTALRALTVPPAGPDAASPDAASPDAVSTGPLSRESPTS